MTRRTLSGIILCAPGGYLLGQSASAKLLTDESDRKTWAWLLKRYGEKEVIKKKRNKVELLGMTNKGPYDVAIILDSKGRVVRARFNHGNFENNEWSKLAGFRHLRDLTCWHNFRKHKAGEPRPDLDGPHDLSGVGLVSFKMHPLNSFNIGGSSFNDLGMAVVAQLPNMRKVRAYHTRVTDQGLKTLEGNEWIRFLNVGPQFSMRITESALESIGKMKALTELEFNETRVTWGAGLAHLLPLKEKLKRVKLEKAWIDDACLQRARKAFPKTIFEHSVPEQKNINQMKKMGI